MGDTYQKRVSTWMRAIADNDSVDSVERTHRFLEESLEMAQASGCSRDEAAALLDYVYNRPTGDPELEAGGVMVTLAGLCVSLKIDMQAAGDAELSRNWKRIDAIKLKRRSKPAGSALPQ